MTNNNNNSNWEEFKLKVKKIWHDLTDEDLEEAEGDKNRASEKIAKKYGLSREEVDHRLDEKDI
jgi:uncharacterized protein YjbJ (UPF0337 family)